MALLGAALGGGGARLSATLLLNDQMSKGLLHAQRNVGSFEAYMSNRFGPRVGESLTHVGRGLVNTGRLAVGFTGVLAVAGRNIAKFDKQIAGIAAVIGETSKDAVGPVRQQAIDLSTQFAFSAQEIAEGQLFIAQAGGKLNDVLTSTPEILNLATATMENFDIAAKLTIKTLNAFGNQISEVAEVRRVVNDLQFAVNNSVNTLQSLNDSLKFAAPFAHVLGIELEDLLSVFILTSNAGIEAGIAGRSLGQGLQQLVRSGMRGATEEAQQFAAQLSDVINTGGTLADVVDTVEQRFGVLNGAEQDQIKALNEMSDAEIEAIENGNSLITVTGKLSELVQVFGVRGARVFGLLLGQSGKLREFKAAMDLQVISAADQARVAMDNLADQVQISLNKINQGILESKFGETLGKQFEELNSSGKLTKLGDELGESLTNLAEDLIPVLIDSVTTLVDLLDAAGPGLQLSFEVIATVLKTVSEILDILPEGVSKVIIAAVLLNKTLGLTPLLFRRLGIAAVAAGSAGTKSFTTLGFQLKKLELAQKSARSEVIKFGIQHKISGGIVREELRAVDAQYTKLIASQKRAASLAAGRRATGAALGLGLTALTVGATLAEKRQEKSSGEILTDSLFAGLGAGAAVAFAGGANPVSVGVGVGTALIVGVTEFMKSEKAKAEAKKANETLASLLSSEEFVNRLKNLGQDVGSQMAAAIEIGLRLGTSDLLATVTAITHDPAFLEAVELVKLSGGRLQFNPGLQSGTVISDVGKKNILKTGGRNNVRSPYNVFGLIPGSIGKTNQTETSVFDNPRLQTLLTSLKLTGVEGQGLTGVDTEGELEDALDHLAVKIRAAAEIEQELTNEKLTSIQAIALEDARRIATTSKVAETETVDGVTRQTQAFTNILEAQEARIKSETGFVSRSPEEIISGLAQSLLAGTGLENLAQLLVGQALGEGFAATDFDVILGQDGTFTVQASFDKVSNSVLEEALASGGITGELTETQLSATTFKLAEHTANLGVTIATYQQNLQSSMNAFLDLQTKVTELGKGVADAALNVTKSKATGAGALSEFLASNANALGFNNEEVKAANDELIKVKVFEKIVTLRELQFSQKDAEIKRAIQQNELSLVNAKLDIARTDLQSDLDTLKTKLLLRDAYAVILEDLETQAVSSIAKQRLATIREELEALKNIRGSYDDIIKAQDGVAALVAKYGIEQDKVRALVAQQVANITNMNSFIEELATSLGINLNQLSAIEKETFFAWAKTLVAAEEAEQLSESISSMLRGAEGLGNALNESQQTFIDLGFSAKEVDEALSQFKKVQFLNSMLGFLHNFQELATSTGSNLGIQDTIVAIQHRLLAAGDGFLKELLDITDPETFADILSRQNFLEQNVTKTTQINLEANLIFPDGITVDQREEISQVAIEAVAQALNNSPVFD